jgi:hypothetical protein
VGQFGGSSEEEAKRQGGSCEESIHGQNGPWGLLIAGMQKDLVACPQGRERERERALPGVRRREHAAERAEGVAQRLAPINAAGTRSCGEERRQTFAAARIGSEELPVRRRRGAAASRARSGDGCEVLRRGAAARSGGEERRRGAAARSSSGGEMRRQAAVAESEFGGEELL